jgi:hypothetical protein
MTDYQKLGLLYKKIAGFEPKHTTDSSSGIVDPQQIFRGRADYFIRHSPKEPFAKKKVIIRDWFLDKKLAGKKLYDIEAQSNSKKINFYCKLQKDDFKLYGYINGQLRELNNLDELDSLEFKTEHEIREEAAKIGLTSDEIYIAGPFNSLELIDKEEYLFKVNKLKKFTKELTYKLLQELPSKGSIKLYIEVKAGYKNFDLPAEFWQQVDAIIIDHSFTTSEEINELLLKIANVKIVAFLTPFIDYSTIKIPALVEEVAINAEQLTFTALEQLTKNCPCLKRIRLCCVYGNAHGSLGDIKDFRLPESVEEIEIANVNISYTDLQQLIQNCNCLKKITFNSCKLGDIKSFRLPESVEGIDIANTTIGDTDLQQLIQNCNCLKKITFNASNLRDIKAFKLPESVEEIDLSVEEDIDLNVPNICWADLKRLTQNCHNLRRIKLNHALLHELIGYKGDFKLLESVEEINISNLPISYADLQKLSQYYPQLKKFILTGCHVIDGTKPEDFTQGDCELVDEPIPYYKNTDIAESNPVRQFFPQATTIDSDTEHTASLSDIEYFKPKKANDQNIDPRNYRLKVFPTYDKEKIEFSPCHSSEDFVEVSGISHIKDLEQKYDLNYQDSSEHFLGKIKFQASSGHYAIPSITSSDQLIGIECQPKTEYSIVFCEREGLYYLKLPKAVDDLTVHFLIKTTPSQLPILPPDQHRLSGLKFTEDGRLNAAWLYEENEADKIHLLTHYFKGFKAKKLSKTELSKKEKLNLIMEEQAGHCRHRAKCFVAAALELGLKARLVGNNSHEFVEVYHNNRWGTIDLGGTFARREIKAYEQDKKEASSLVLSAPNTHNPFYPKTQETSSVKNIDDYASAILKQAEDLKQKNILCVLDKKQIESFYFAMIKLNPDSYFISDLDEISLTDVVIDNNNATISDSELAKFLKLGKGVLVIDWSQCRPQHIGLNSIIDAQRRIEKACLAKGVIVVSLLEKGVKMGEDFYSRHQRINIVPEELKEEAKQEIGAENLKQAELQFYSDDWRQHLYGRIKLSATGYSFVPSAMVEQITQGARLITLRGAPWDDREFRLAIKEIELKGTIHVNGAVLECPNIRFRRDDRAYNLSSLKQAEFASAEEYQVVNNATFHNLFEQIHIFNLSPGEWAKLASLDATVVLGNGVALPGSPAKSLEPTSNNQTEIILTNDLGVCRKEHKGKVIIDINIKTTFSDLLEKITYEAGSFTHKVSVLAQALHEGKEVVLVGNPSRQLAKQLESLFINKPYMMINGKRKNFQGKLTLIAENVEGLEMIKQHEMKFSKEEIWLQLAKDNYSKDDIKTLRGLLENLPQLGNLSYTEMAAALQRMRIKPHANPLKHLLRLRPDYLALKPELERLWPKYRLMAKPSPLEKVNKALKNGDCAVLVGPSGVGKSRFVQNELSVKYEILEGMDKLDLLTQKSASGKPRLLFVDEANLTTTPEIYEVFNGLLNGARRLLVNGELKDLPVGHKVVLAGNYGHFQGRSNIKYIGEIISFKELKDETIKTEIMTPILKQLFPAAGVSDLEKVTTLVIMAYHYINKQFPDKHPLTARNLQMICLRCKKLYDDGIKEPRLLAAMAVYDEVSVMLSKSERQEFRNWLENIFEVAQIKANKAELKDKVIVPGLAVTQSRKNLIRLLDYMLTIREFKIKTQNFATAGLNGFLIEGGSGIGKSYTAKHFLESQGFRDGFSHVNASKKYYLITPTNYADVESTLKRAFDEGAVVILDEINTMPLETMLNSLLSGVNSDGKAAKHKGFMVIGTQNPISFGNRLTFSDALNKRFQKFNLKDYKEPELTVLLQTITKAPSSWLKATVTSYLSAINYAKRNNMPAPNLRQLIDYSQQSGYAIQPQEGPTVKSVKHAVIQLPNAPASKLSQLAIEVKGYLLAFLESEIARLQTDFSIIGSKPKYNQATLDTQHKLNMFQRLKDELDPLEIKAENYAKLKKIVDDTKRAASIRRSKEDRNIFKNLLAAIAEFLKYFSIFKTTSSNKFSKEIKASCRRFQKQVEEESSKHNKPITIR